MPATPPLPCRGSRPLAIPGLAWRRALGDCRPCGGSLLGCVGRSGLSLVPAHWVCMCGGSRLCAGNVCVVFWPFPFRCSGALPSPPFQRFRLHRLLCAPAVPRAMLWFRSVAPPRRDRRDGAPAPPPGLIGSMQPWCWVVAPPDASHMCGGMFPQWPRCELARASAWQPDAPMHASTCRHSCAPWEAWDLVGVCRKLI